MKTWQYRCLSTLACVTAPWVGAGIVFGIAALVHRPAVSNPSLPPVIISAPPRISVFPPRIFYVAPSQPPPLIFRMSPAASVTHSYVPVPYYVPHYAVSSAPMRVPEPAEVLPVTSIPDEDTTPAVRPVPRRVPTLRLYRIGYILRPLHLFILYRLLLYLFILYRRRRLRYLLYRARLCRHPAW